MSGFVKVEPQAVTTTSTTARPTTTTTTPAAAATADPKFGAAAASTAQRGVATVSSTAPTTTTSPIAAAPSPVSSAAGGTVTSPATGDQVSDIEAEVDADEVAFQTAAADEADQGGTTMLILAIGFIVALLGGAGVWGWYHRSSRYQPA